MSSSPIRLAVTELVRGPRWIVLLHGLQSNRAMYELFFHERRLSADSLLSIDLVGFGESDKPEGFCYDLKDQAEQVSRVVDEKIKGGATIVLLGHSLGGMIGTLLLEMKPSRYAALISLEGNLAEADCGDSLKVSAQDPKTFETYYQNFRAEVARQNDGTGLARAKWMESTPARVFLASSKTIVEWSRGGRLSRIFETSTQPKLLLIGEKSKFRSRPTGQHISVERISGAGHFMLLQQPKQVIDHLCRFLKN